MRIQSFCQNIFAIQSRIDSQNSFHLPQTCWKCCFHRILRKSWVSTESKERPHCSSSLYPHSSPAFPRSPSCAQGRLRPCQTQKRLLIMAFVSLSSPRKPGEGPQACPEAGRRCVCWSPAPPRQHSSCRHPEPSPGALAAAQHRQPAPKSPVAMALQQHCREPRLLARHTTEQETWEWLPECVWGPIHPPRSGHTKELSQHLAAAADKAALRSCAPKPCQCTACVR